MALQFNPRALFLSHADLLSLPPGEAIKLQLPLVLLKQPALSQGEAVLARPARPRQPPARATGSR
jgi:hypothetical protein